MATYNSSQYAQIVNQETGAHDVVKASDHGGRLRLARFSILTTATIATADVYQLTRLPYGARFLYMILSNESCGTTAPADFGDAGDQDRLVAALALQTASTPNTPRICGRNETGKTYADLDTSTSPPSDAIALGVGYRYLADTDILMTFGTVSGGAAAGVEIEGCIVYSVD